MTETTQALTISVPDPHAAPAQQRREQLLQGQPIFLSDCRALAEPDAGTRQTGSIQVRGPAVATGYLRRPDLSPLSDDGWLDTGDIGSVGPQGHMQITDRAKDAIKSGGEWISSVELENIALGCPGIAQAACVGVPHPRWQERPILLLVADPPPADADEHKVRTHLSGRIARWWMPDAFVFVDHLPRNGVGKVLKASLREQYRHLLLNEMI